MTGRRLQPSRQPTLDAEAIRRIAELESEMLNIVHDHFGSDLPTVTPLYISTQGVEPKLPEPEKCRLPTDLGRQRQVADQLVRDRLKAGSFSESCADISVRSDR